MSDVKDLCYHHVLQPFYCYSVNPVRVSTAATTAITRVTVCSAVTNDTNTKLAGAEVPQHLLSRFLRSTDHLSPKTANRLF